MNKEYLSMMDIRGISDAVSVTTDGVEQSIDEMLKSVEVDVFLEKRILTEDMVIGWMFCEMYYAEKEGE